MTVEDETLYLDGTELKAHEIKIDEKGFVPPAPTQPSERISELVGLPWLLSRICSWPASQRTPGL